MDKLINYGGAVKALQDGKVEGYLVLFGDPENTDISRQRDFFTPDTDFGIEEGAKTAIYYRHALDPNLDTKIGEGSLKVDEVGVWVEGQLDLRDRYVKAVYDKMATKDALGWSSGTAVHLVQREKQDNGAHKITRWPLGLDASLTPDPAEPRTQAVTALKSLEPDALLPKLLGEETAAKSVFGDNARQEATMAAVRALNDRLFYSVICDCIYDWKKDGQTATPLPERLATLREAFDEFRDVALRVVEAVLTAAPEAEDADGAMKALKALWGPERPESLADHSVKVVSAAADFAERLESRLEARKADGRSLSQANRDALKAALTSLDEVDAVKSRLSRVLAEAEPAQTTQSPDELSRQTQALKLRARASLAAYGYHGARCNE